MASKNIFSASNFWTDIVLLYLLVIMFMRNQVFAICLMPSLQILCSRLLTVFSCSRVFLLVDNKYLLNEVWEILVMAVNDLSALLSRSLFLICDTDSPTLKIFESVFERRTMIARMLGFAKLTYLILTEKMVHHVYTILHS